MGGIAAILRLDGAPPSHRDLDRMLAASRHRGPGGASAWTDPDGIALGYLAFETTSEAEPQPLLDPVRRLALVFDGRLDNRGELAAALNIGDAAASDARLVLEAVAAWGADAPARMLGDFAWIVWDGARRRLLAARDHLGIRPLHYCAQPGVVLCASDIAQVLADSSIPREPDLAIVADYLSQDRRNDAATLIRGINRVPPGHLLVVEGRTPTLHQYWTLGPRAPIRLRDDVEYAERCRDLLVQSVRCRTRARRPVAALLSGGLDSSSVVTVASRVLGGAGAVRPFSMIFPLVAEADERPFIDDVATQCGLTSVFVEPGPVTVDAVRRHTAATLDYPAFGSDFTAVTMYDAIRSQGHEVVLTGAGGDYVFGGSPFSYADLLREGRIGAAVRQFLVDRRTDSSGWAPLGLVQSGVWPLLPARAKRALRPLARRVSGFTDRPSWLRLPRASYPPLPDEPRGGSFATEEIVRELGGGLHSLFLEAGERMLASIPLEARHPLLDVRLIEFALSVPEDQRRRGSTTKFVLRNALAGQLPSSVAGRRTKALLGSRIADILESLGGARFFSTLQIAEEGWVDGPAVAALYARMRRRIGAGDPRFGNDLPSLWTIAAMEVWFEAVARRGVTSPRAHAMM
jgi:asparagine synthase (glutamine-hydrolysing)